MTCGLHSQRSVTHALVTKRKLYILRITMIFSIFAESMKTYILQELNEANAARIDTLLHMLSPDAPSLGPARLAELLAGDSFWLFVTEDNDGVLAGMLTLTRCHTLSRSKFWIEDVIVDPAYRGQRVGRALVHAAVDYVKASEESPSLYLTSNPSRTAARALYRSEGFEEYETGVFRIV